MFEGFLMEKALPHCGFAVDESLKGGDLVNDHVDSQQLDIYKHDQNSTITEAPVPPASGFGKQSRGVCVCVC